MFPPPRTVVGQPMQPADPYRNRIHNQVGFGDQPREPIQHAEPEVAVPITEPGTDERVGQAIFRSVMLDPAGCRVHTVHASAHADIDAAKLIFRQTARCVTRQTLSDAVNLECRSICGRIIDARHSSKAAGYPNTAGVIRKNLSDYAFGRSINRAPVAEAAGSITRLAIRKADPDISLYVLTKAVRHTVGQPVSCSVFLETVCRAIKAGQR